MGMTTSIYGVIREYGLNHDRRDEVYLHNDKMLSSLPVADDWPPVSREMFSITKDNSDSGPNLEYWGRAIHFGACLKSVEEEWQDWKTKFESLLTRLYWLEAYVHFKTEYTGVISFSWSVDLLKWSIKDGDIRPISPDFWEFKDIDSWEK